jgi:hypothetical protein
VLPFHATSQERVRQQIFGLERRSDDCQHGERARDVDHFPRLEAHRVARTERETAVCVLAVEMYIDNYTQRVMVDRKIVVCCSLRSSCHGDVDRTIVDYKSLLSRSGAMAIGIDSSAGAIAGGRVTDVWEATWTTGVGRFGSKSAEFTAYG